MDMTSFPYLLSLSLTMNNATSIEPPPEMTYCSLEAAMLATETQARANAYAVSVKHSRSFGNKVDGYIKSIVSYCCNADTPVLKAQKHRTTSHKKGFNFKVSEHKQAEVFQV